MPSKTSLSQSTIPDSNPSHSQPVAKTPEPARNESDDLYGLSPKGEISRARLEAAESVQRAQLHQPQSVIKAVSTPAVENSILALTKFKRRKRQPSIIRMIQSAATSEVGDYEDLDLDFDLDGFEPQGESTPLHLAGMQMKMVDSRQASPQTTSSRKRKRGEDVVVARTSSPISSPAGSPLPEPQRSVEVHEALEESLSETNAPPMSDTPESSVMDADALVKTSKNIGDNTKQRRRATQISTTHLESLMPRAARRSRRNKEHELDLSDSTSADEIEPSPVRARGRRPTAAPKRAATKVRKALAEKKTAQSTSNTAKSPASKSKRRATYGRREDAEKENEQDDSDSFFPEPVEVEASSFLEEVAKSSELTKMKNKFAEIDDWEMEYESVDLGGGTSSPWR